MSFPDAPRRLRPRPWRASGLVIENLRLSRLVLCSPPVRTRRRVESRLDRRHGLERAAALAFDVVKPR